MAVISRLEKGRNQAVKILDFMRQKGVSVQLFGSMKTGNAFPNSDVDLLVTDCGPLDSEVILVEIHPIESEIPVDMVFLQLVPKESIGCVMKSLLE